MSISGVGYRSNLLVQSLGDMRRSSRRPAAPARHRPEVDDVRRARRRTVVFAVGLRNQLSLMTGYADAVKNIGVRINLAQSSLADISKISSTVKAAANTSTFTIDNTGQTISQRSAVLAARPDADPDEHAGGRPLSVLGPCLQQAGHDFARRDRERRRPRTRASSRSWPSAGRPTSARTVLDGCSIRRRPRAAATLAGTGATLTADASATVAGTQDISGAFTSGGGTLTINGINVTIPNGADQAAILAAINAPGSFRKPASPRPRRAACSR